MQETHRIKSERFTLLVRNDYEVDLEYNKDFAILHLPYIERMTKSVYLDMVSTINGLDKFLETVGFKSLWAAIPPQNSTLPKLVKKLDFTYRGSADGYDVYEREF